MGGTILWTETGWNQSRERRRLAEHQQSLCHALVKQANSHSLPCFGHHDAANVLKPWAETSLSPLQLPHQVIKEARGTKSSTFSCKVSSLLTYKGLTVSHFQIHISLPWAVFWVSVVKVCEIIHLIFKEISRDGYSYGSPNVRTEQSSAQS